LNTSGGILPCPLLPIAGKMDLAGIILPACYNVKSLFYDMKNMAEECHESNDRPGE
jgi:hypothetical protein